MITENFKIEIRHHNFQGGGYPKYRKLDDYRGSFKRPKYNGKTEVTIKDKEGNVLEKGLALCSNLDNFCRVKGFLIALDRATENLQEKYQDEIYDAVTDLPRVKRHINNIVFGLPKLK